MFQEICAVSPHIVQELVSVTEMQVLILINNVGPKARMQELSVQSPFVAISEDGRHVVRTVAIKWDHESIKHRLFWSLHSINR